MLPPQIIIVNTATACARLIKIVIILKMCCCEYSTGDVSFRMVKTTVKNNGNVEDRTRHREILSVVITRIQLTRI